MKVTLYTKPGCSLCFKAKKLLEELRSERAFELEEIDITGDEALYERYRWEIPVIAVEGVERLRGRFSIDELRDALFGDR